MLEGQETRTIRPVTTGRINFDQGQGDGGTDQSLLTSICQRRSPGLVSEALVPCGCRGGTVQCHLFRLHRGWDLGKRLEPSNQIKRFVGVNYVCFNFARDGAKSRKIMRGYGGDRGRDLAGSSGPLRCEELLGS